jgi:hypothetical protein
MKIQDCADLLIRIPDGTFLVASNTVANKNYTITVQNGIPKCSCKGFMFRGNCSHKKEFVQKMIRRERISKQAV